MGTKERKKRLVLKNQYYSDFTIETENEIFTFSAKIGNNNFSVRFKLTDLSFLKTTDTSKIIIEDRVKTENTVMLHDFFNDSKSILNFLYKVSVLKQTINNFCYKEQNKQNSVVKLNSQYGYGSGEINIIRINQSKKILLIKDCNVQIIFTNSEEHLRILKRTETLLNDFLEFILNKLRKAERIEIIKKYNKLINN